DLVRYTESEPAWNDRDPLRRLGVFGEVRDDGVTRFMNGHAVSLFLVELRVPPVPEDDLVVCGAEVFLVDRIGPSPRGGGRPLVHEAGEVGARKARSAPRDPTEVYVFCERLVTRVHAQDGQARLELWFVHDDSAIEPAGAQQCGVEHVRTV